MGLNRRQLAVIRSYFHRSRASLDFWIAASKLHRRAMDDSDQPLYPCWCLAYCSQYVDPLFLWNIPVQVDWREQVHHHLLLGRDIGKCFLYASGRSFFHSYWCLGSCFRHRRSTDGAAPKSEGFSIPHTSPSPSLDSSHWSFLHNLPCPECSVAGPPWRSVTWSHSRLFLQEKGTLFLLV